MPVLDTADRRQSARTAPATLRGGRAATGPRAAGEIRLPGPRPGGEPVPVTDTEVRPRIDTALVRKLIAAQFPQWEGLAVTPVAAGGVDNRTFHLGGSMSVRLPSAGEYAAQAAKEYRWLPVLAPRLPLPVPSPIAKGEPAEGYPFHWTVNRWIEGETASSELIGDTDRFAADLAGFLVALRRIDTAGGPPGGPENSFRGVPLAGSGRRPEGQGDFDTQTRRALDTLTGSRHPHRLTRAAASAVEALWEEALRAGEDVRPVWFHGDVARGNLLLRDGRLSAVIDFGCSGVGDPACDLTVAWTLLTGGSREIFREAVYAEGSLDPGAWARGRGWALWKSLITLAWGDDEADCAAASYVVGEVLGD
jgi:aminoglycoside phosphotransferase (APT) family kinase protein